MRLISTAHRLFRFFGSCEISAYVTLCAIVDKGSYDSAYKHTLPLLSLPKLALVLKAAFAQLLFNWLVRWSTLSFCSIFPSQIFLPRRHDPLPKNRTHNLRLGPRERVHNGFKPDLKDLAEELPDRLFGLRTSRVVGHARRAAGGG